MNEFPHFSPNAPALEQLSSTRMNMISLGQKSNQVQPGFRTRITQTPGGTTVSSIKQRIPSQKFPPLSGHLTWDDETINLYMDYGIVTSWINDNGPSAVVAWEIANLPTQSTPLEVLLGDKISCKITVNDLGAVTAAEIDKSTSWPDSTAPELAGGDNATGTTGTLYVRLLEIIDHPDYEGLIIVKHHRTGNVDHKPATLSENTIATASAGQARVMKEWNASYGRWDFRYLEEGAGITLTETADKITIESSGGGGEDHPWKVTASETANQWDVVLDTIYGHGEEITPTIASPFTFTPSSTGFIYVKITRDASTRVPLEAEVLADATVPTSTEEFQYRALAFVTDTPSVLQLQFEEMRIQELLVIENGAYKLAPLELSSRNSYDLPS